ncbi:MAG: ATP-binding cassette domain-containing protein [Lachnospiraceae bacterium]|nr:ATP-binding cassette domain-containing protein [Lachnospiraceae bacterium]
MTLKVSGLSKEYKKKRALDNVDLEFTAGVCGLLGPNGSGKSTLLNIICGAVKANSGKILLDENDVSSIPLSYRKIIRVLYQKPPLIPEYTVIQTMEYGGVLYGISKKEMRAQADELLAKVGLSDCTHLKTSSLSGGMKQRLAIAQMLLGDAKILLFDEPTAGLDITERLKFKKIVEGLKKEHIIIYSTHIYSDLEDLADRLVVLENGKCSYSADIGCIEGMSVQEFVEKGLETGEWQKHI